MLFQSAYSNDMNNVLVYNKSVKQNAYNTLDSTGYEKIH